MKKKLIAMLCISTFFVGTAGATVTVDWGYAADLTAWDPTVSAGWFVQLYQDVNADSVLGSVTFDSSGTASGAGSSADDLLVGTVTTTLVTGKSGVNWSLLAQDWSSLQSASVYTVLYDASTIGAAANSVVIDSIDHTLPADPPGGTDTYALSSVSGSWQAVVPEPGTFALLGIGLLTMGIKRKKQK